MIKDLIALENTSRVWIYPADKEFSYEELDAVRPVIFEFLDNWTSHNRDLVSYGNVFHRRFLALFVDESMAGASGCSIDKSVHFVQHLGNQLDKDFFNRQDVYFLINDEVVKYHLNELRQLAEDGTITEDSLFFDNLVNSKGSFLENWVKPVKEGWVSRFI